MEQVNQDELRALLGTLSESVCAAPGQPAWERIFKEAQDICPAARSDRMGNIFVPVEAPAPGKEHVLLDAHIDEIGFMVTSIDKDGFLRVGAVGGPDKRVLLAHEVTVMGSEPLFGVFCSRPPHLMKDGDEKKVPALDELAIDVGLPHDRAAALVSPGDYVFLRRQPAQLLNGNMTGKSLDNRAGAAAVLTALKLLRGKTLGFGLTAVFSLAEECGERGAVVSAFAAAPTAAVVVDTSHGKTPDAPAEKCGEIGKGPMIGISPFLSRSITDRLFSAAKAEGLPYQTEVMSADTGTNGDAVSVSGEGVATGLVSIPLRYMHTANELIASDDVAATARVLARFLTDFGGDSHA